MGRLHQPGHPGNDTGVQQLGGAGQGVDEIGADEFEPLASFHRGGAEGGDLGARLHRRAHLDSVAQGADCGPGHLRQMPEAEFKAAHLVRPVVFAIAVAVHELAFVHFAVAVGVHKGLAAGQDHRAFFIEEGEAVGKCKGRAIQGEARHEARPVVSDAARVAHADIGSEVQNRSAGGGGDGERVRRGHRADEIDLVHRQPLAAGQGGEDDFLAGGEAVRLIGGEDVLGMAASEAHVHVKVCALGQHIVDDRVLGGDVAVVPRLNLVGDAPPLVGEDGGRLLSSHRRHGVGDGLFHQAQLRPLRGSLGGDGIAGDAVAGDGAVVSRDDAAAGRRASEVKVQVADLRVVGLAVAGDFFKQVIGHAHRVTELALAAAGQGADVPKQGAVVERVAGARHALRRLLQQSVGKLRAEVIARAVPLSDTVKPSAIRDLVSHLAASDLIRGVICGGEGVGDEIASLDDVFVSGQRQKQGRFNLGGQRGREKFLHTGSLVSQPVVQNEPGELHLLIHLDGDKLADMLACLDVSDVPLHVRDHSLGAGHTLEIPWRGRVVMAGGVQPCLRRNETVEHHFFCRRRADVVAAQMVGDELARLHGESVGMGVRNHPSGQYEHGRGGDFEWTGHGAGIGAMTGGIRARAEMQSAMRQHRGGHGALPCHAGLGGSFHYQIWHVGPTGRVIRSGACLDFHIESRQQRSQILPHCECKAVACLGAAFFERLAVHHHHDLRSRRGERQLIAVAVVERHQGARDAPERSGTGGDQFQFDRLVPLVIQGVRQRCDEDLRLRLPVGKDERTFCQSVVQPVFGRAPGDCEVHLQFSRHTSGAHHPDDDWIAILIARVGRSLEGDNRGQRPVAHGLLEGWLKSVAVRPLAGQRDARVGAVQLRWPDDLHTMLPVVLRLQCKQGAIGAPGHRFHLGSARHGVQFLAWIASVLLRWSDLGRQRAESIKGGEQGNFRLITADGALHKGDGLAIGRPGGVCLGGGKVALQRERHRHVGGAAGGDVACHVRHFQQLDGVCTQQRQMPAIGTPSRVRRAGERAAHIHQGHGGAIERVDIATVIKHLDHMDAAVRPRKSQMRAEGRPSDA